VSFGAEMSFGKGIITVNQKIGLRRGEGFLYHIIIFYHRFRIRLRNEAKLFNKSKSSRTIFEEENKVQ
jgi:hypothetical protein